MYKPNGYGLYDTLGNVAEWIDGCADSSAAEPADATVECSHRAARGGSWKSGPEHMHAEARIFLRSGVRSDTVGFRVVRGLSTPPPKEEGMALGTNAEAEE
jgi:formylglycine-generating enzyme required for sulfatase activity